jgi:DNA-binding FadR family transcriptional regulator
LRLAHSPQAAHNGVIGGQYKVINEARSQRECGVLKRRSATPERRLAYQLQHRALVEAIRERDAEKARALSLAHLVEVRTNMLGY